MNKGILTLLLIIGFQCCVLGQVGIGTTTPQGALDITNPNAGVVLPRVSLAGTDDITTVVNPDGGGAPVAGTIVYNTSNAGIGALAVVPGLYFFNGLQWDLVQKTVNVVCVKNYTTGVTISVGDNGCIIAIDSSADVTVTIPSGLPIGFHVSVYQLGNGQLTFTGASGVTLRNRLSRFKSAGIDAGVGIVATNTDQFFLTGDLTK